MAVPGDCRNTVCISKSPGAVMGKQIHSKPYESLCESAQRRSLVLETVDNNDTVSYGCIRVASELQPSVRKMQPS